MTKNNFFKLAIGAFLVLVIGVYAVGVPKLLSLIKNDGVLTSCQDWGFKTISGWTKSFDIWRCGNSEGYYLPVSDHRTVEITVGAHDLIVEVVNQPASITQGLSDRAKMSSEGMLFLLPEKRVVEFWMIRMQFDLDMVWIADEKIVGITANVPKPDPSTPTEKLPLYSSPAAVEMVLELPAGKAQELNLKTGDKFNFK